MEIKQAPFQSQVSQLQLVDSLSYLPAPGSAAGSERVGEVRDIRDFRTQRAPGGEVSGQTI